MSRKMEDMIAEALREKSISVARKMLKTERFSHEEIANFSGLTVDEVKELATKQPA